MQKFQYLPFNFCVKREHNVNEVSGHIYQQVWKFLWCHVNITIKTMDTLFMQINQSSTIFLAELSWAWSIHGGAPRVRKFGDLCIWEILAVKWPYFCPPTHSSTPQAHQCKITQSTGDGNPNVTQGFIWQEITWLPGLLERKKKQQQSRVFSDFHRSPIRHRNSRILEVSWRYKALNTTYAEWSCTLYEASIPSFADILSSM